MIVKRTSEYMVGCPEVGDKIDFTLKTGEKVEAMAVKELTNGTMFCTVDFLSKPYPMNRNGGTRGGYEASDLRKHLNGEVLDSFPDDIRKQLIPLGNGDLLTIPSEREMFGRNLYAEEDEGDIMQWEPMKNRHNRIAFRNGGYEWGWLRNVASSTYFAYVNGLGNADYAGASHAYGVRPVFIIGNGEKRMRPINVDALEKTLGDWVRDHWTEAFTGDDAGSEFANIIDHAETIEQSPIVHEHWEAKYNPEELSSDTLCKCSNCREEEPICFISDWNFYPHCDAKMDYII